ncbi:MAG: restriction endonuclease subunit S [Schwartzia sp.]|nr:restriction endonuclease subunit S [Schwartzia sp. (in: firmicutes)]MBR1553039.1 restriction endonuclease subunit S [Schwartzia sp. (in: firmicutes)]
MTFLDLDQYATATEQPGLSVNKIQKIPIKYAPFPEQKEIVRILDAIFEREQTAKQIAERLLEKIALTKKAILARAFRDALGTNGPTEKSAAGLLA